MNNYSKILTFFIEHNVQLTTSQLANLKEEFLNESNVGEDAEEAKDDIVNGLDPNDQYRNDQGRVIPPKSKKKKKKNIDIKELEKEEDNENSLGDYNIEEND